MNHELSDYCKDALQIQDACNPIAIVGCFHKHLTENHQNYNGFTELMQDAPFKLFMDKLCDLSTFSRDFDYRKCTEACENIVD